MNDPPVAEVRKHRMEHSREFGSDLRLICKDLRKSESTLGKRLAKAAARRPKRAKVRKTSRGRSPLRNVIWS